MKALTAKSAMSMAMSTVISIAGAALLTTAAYAQTAPYGAYDTANGAQPLYDTAASPDVGLYTVACVGGRGIGRYPNPVAYGDSATAIESGGEFNVGRGYHGCFVFPSE